MHGFFNFESEPKTRNERNLLTRLERTPASGLLKNRKLTIKPRKVEFCGFYP